MTAPTTTAPDYKLGPVLPHVKGAANIIGPMFGVTTILGWRATARDMTGHPAGRALDIMCTKAQGDQIVAFMMQNNVPLAVDYLLWQQRSWDPDDGEWKPMEDRGSATQNHMDHVHAQFKLTPGKGSFGEAGLNESVLDQLNPFGNWTGDVLSIAMKVLISGGALALFVMGINRTVSSEK